MDRRRPRSRGRVQRMVRQGTRSGASGGAGIFERPPLHGGRRRAQVSRALRTRRRECAQERRLREGQQVADAVDAEDRETLSQHGAPRIPPNLLLRQSAPPPPRLPPPPSTHTPPPPPAPPPP